MQLAYTLLKHLLATLALSLEGLLCICSSNIENALQFLDIINISASLFTY